MITAPIPSIPNFEDDVKPTKKTQTTVEYKYTSREYNEYTDSRTPTYDEYQSTPNYRGTLGGYDQTTAYKTPTDFDAAKDASDFDIPGTDYAQTTSDDPYTSEFDAPKISTTTYDVPRPTAFTNAANTANIGYVRTTSNDYSILSEYDTPKITPTSFTPRSSSTNFPNTVTNQEYVRTTLGDAYDTRSDFDSKISTYLPRGTATNFPTNTIPQGFRTTGNTYPETDSSTEFVSKTSPTYVPKFPSSDYSNTINQEYVGSTLSSYGTTPTELNSPRISTTLAPPPSSPTRYFERTTFTDTPTETSPRISTGFVPKSTATTKFSRSGSRFSPASSTVAATDYTSVQRGSTPRYRTEKLIPVPVENTGYSTASYTGSSQEPSYFTREYLLESPVTKTYDGKWYL